MKCTRKACNAQGTQTHRDLPGKYCRPCGNRINEACGVEVVDMAAPPKPFWTSVRELAALREHIPEERRAFSGVRQAMQRDLGYCENGGVVGCGCRTCMRRPQ